MKVKVEKRKVDFQEVIVHEPTVEDMLKAEKMSGGDRGLEFAVALVSLITEFDGQKLTPEEVRKLPASVFLALSQAFRQLGLVELGEQLSTSQK